MAKRAVARLNSELAANAAGLSDAISAPLPGEADSSCGASLSARCFNGEAGCLTHPRRGA